MQTDEPNIFSMTDKVQTEEALAKAREHDLRVKTYAKHDRAIGDMQEELVRASKRGPFHSLHDAYAHILEELDEVWDHVRTKQRDRDLDATRKELVQVAAMAIKAIEVIDSGRGRV